MWRRREVIGDCVLSRGAAAVNSQWAEAPGCMNRAPAPPTFLLRLIHPRRAAAPSWRLIRVRMAAWTKPYARAPTGRFRFRLKGLFAAMILAGIAASRAELETLAFSIWVTLTSLLSVQAVILSHEIVSEANSPNDASSPCP